jgi:hypothetical protein
MKTYRRNTKKNKTKKNKRRYKLKGGMGTGEVAYTQYNCPNCGFKTDMSCFYSGVEPKPDDLCRCNNSNCHLYSKSSKPWIGTHQELKDKVQKY